MNIIRSVFGKIDGLIIEKISVITDSDSRVEIINYGATVHSWVVRDKSGCSKEILLGRDTLQGYVDDHPNFGCVIGRYANRIKDGHFESDGKSIQLSRNLNGHHLHGGWEGFGKKVWTISDVQTFPDRCEIMMSYISPDGEEGYPGNLKVEITFIITNGNELILILQGKSDKNTICNMTNHCYFNLGNQTQITDHHLKINSTEITEVQSDLIPTGNIIHIQNTPFDFLQFRQIDLNKKFIDKIMEFGNGYDINYVLYPRNNYKQEPVAELFHAGSGLKLLVYTSKPGLQLYTGNWLDGVKGRNNIVYKKHSGICLEPQDFPDAPNHPAFPSVILKKDEIYYHFMKYKITTFENKVISYC